MTALVYARVLAVALLCLNLVGALAPTFYFAYGSNVLSDVIEGRRGCRPLSRTAALCTGHRLTFSMIGLPGIEPAFANIEDSVRDTCHGVLYELQFFDWLKLCASEGVPFAYKVVEVNIRPYSGTPAPNDPVIRALTLQSRQPQTLLGLPSLELRPSRRYIELLRKGSVEAGLAPSWRSKLENL